MGWLIFALITMITFSIANIALSQVAKAIPTASISMSTLNLILSNPRFLVLIIIYLTFSIAGFFTMFKALQVGKTAPVIAIFNLSTLFIALVSVFMFRQTFSLKEILAMALAMGSIFLFTV